MEQGEIKTTATQVGKRSFKVTCLQLEKEKLILMSNGVVGKESLEEYKQRWSIEI